PDVTVLIRTRGVLIRADVRRNKQPQTTLWRNLPQDAPDAVKHALKEGGRPAKRVWVLDSEVWLGEVGLSGSAVAGLSDKELVSPAAFEAEAITDLRPDEAVTVVKRRRIPQQEDQFLVAQQRREQVMAIGKAVRAAGAKLAGLGHPAGLPVALEQVSEDMEAPAAPAPRDWRRVEFWADSVFLTESVAGRVGLISLGIAPGSDWRRALEPHLRDSDPFEDDHTLMEPGVRVRGGPGWQDAGGMSSTARWLATADEPEAVDDTFPLFDLGDDRACEAFVGSWGMHLLGLARADESLTPTLRQPKAPAARWPAVLVGIVALGLSGYFVYEKREADAAELAGLQQQMAAGQARTSKVNTRRSDASRQALELQAKRTEVQNLEQRIKQREQARARARAEAPPVEVDRRMAIARMMTVLEDASSRDLVIHSIESRGGRHTVRGMATTPGAAAHLASDLSHELEGLWVVRPSDIEPDPQSGPERLIWKFTTVLESTTGKEAKR
ncbi:MAG: hypothetical protein AAGG01_05590, partial [Planctomycetota bacterium]